MLVLAWLTIQVNVVKNAKHSNLFLEKELNEIANYIPYKDSENPKVSKVGVAWHLDHSLKVINRVYTSLEKSEPKQFRSSFSLSRVFVYATGIIPRGVAQSPRSTLPPSEILEKDLYLQISQARTNLDSLLKLDPNAHFTHPYFKVINKKQSIRFIVIHTKHHLKIIRDILKN